jgi:hypothetical protein
MRIAVISGLSALLVLVCFPHPATAQSSQSSPVAQALSPGLLPWLGGPSEFPTHAQTGTAASGADSAGNPWLQALEGLGHRVQVDPFLKDQQESGPPGVHSSPKTNQCAHILLYKAPPVDSKMITEIPKQLLGKTPRFKGLQVCPEDVRPAVPPQADPFAAPEGRIHP